ncbi:MAG: hypothetical protein RLZZ15_4048, partial [Verrucomicrobiota bacterium]
MIFPVRAAALLLATLVVASPVARALPLSLRAGAETTWAENIARSSAPSNWIDTLRQEAHVGASRLMPLDTGVSLVGDLEASWVAVPRFTQNNTLTLRATVALRKKFGLGPLAPVLTAEAGLARVESRLRGEDAWVASGAVRVTKRFDDSWRAALTADWEQHYAAGAPFDTRHHRLLGSLAWDVTDRWQLSAGAGALWGDFVASAGPAVWARALAGQITPAIGAYYPTLSWAVTDSYGRGWVSYRAKGRSDFWWLELAPSLGRNTSLPLRYAHSVTGNFVGVKYQQDLWS